MTRPVPAAFTALLVALLGGWLWDAPRAPDPDHAIRAAEFRGDLLEAHTALLGARADLYQRNFRSASRQLEDARVLLRRAEAQGLRLGWQDEVQALDLAGFESDIDQAQRLLDQLDQGTDSRVLNQTRLGGVATQPTFLLR